jgi:phage anti-repressor protein
MYPRSIYVPNNKYNTAGYWKYDYVRQLDSPKHIVLYERTFDRKPIMVMFKIIDGKIVPVGKKIYVSLIDFYREASTENRSEHFLRMRQRFIEKYIEYFL